ncbi:MAG: four helix bundle protein [Planctomycetes bacterium]|nr:four helix bundle protein [Planctomycetota bacterium]
MTYQSYKDLDIYKMAHKLAIEIHEMSLKLPKFEMYEEGSQIRVREKITLHSRISFSGHLCPIFTL